MRRNEREGAEKYEHLITLHLRLIYLNIFSSCYVNMIIFINVFDRILNVVRAIQLYDKCWIVSKCAFNEVCPFERAKFR